jgi:glycosyltransferase involved in cell wall biosynthesis
VLKVSVIVPVYNPGPNIDDCIRTLLDQSLAADEYEVVFVDDGSTDETPARLDALAAEHANVRVEHIPNSGWPGRPRNVGVELARGEFVYFVDNDDWLGHEALERLVAAAESDEADIVIGKVVGHGKDVPRQLFRRTRHAITFDDAPLLALLTPHKLFRTAFLAEHGIRFPEGRRRLEDHVFVVHAYFHARSITVLSDYAYYHWVLRDAEENASFQAFDPVGYFENVREVLDIVEEHTEPGPRRDKLLSHWYRGKMLKRVGGGGFFRRDPDYNRVMVQEVRRLALERYGPEVHDHLAFHLRVRSHLLREGTLDDLLALAAFEMRLRARSTVDVRGRRRGATLRIQSRIEGDEEPLRFERRGDRILWVPPATLRDRLPEAALDATRDIEKSRVQVLVRSKADRSEFLLPTELVPTVDEDGGVTVAGDALLDVRKAAGGAKLPPGDWEVRGIVSIAGFQAVGAMRRAGRTGALALTVTNGGQVIEKATGTRESAGPPTLKRRIARRLPWLVRLVRRTGAGSAAARRR